MLITILPSTLLQIFCEIILNFKVISKYHIQRTLIRMYGIKITDKQVQTLYLSEKVASDLGVGIDFHLALLSFFLCTYKWQVTSKSNYGKKRDENQNS